MPERAAIAPPSGSALLLAAALAVASFVVAPAHRVLSATPSDQIYVPVTGSTVSTITTSPTPLNMAFSQSVHDYTVRCQQGVNNITLTLTATSGTITAGGQTGSTVNVTVGLAESQAVVVQVPDATNEFWIRCLPHDFPVLSVTKPGTPPAGWYLTGNITSSTDSTSSTYAMILDTNGTPVWYQAAPGGAIGTELLPGSKTIAWAPSLGPGFGVNPNGAFNLYTLDTQITQSYPAKIQPTDPHELLQTPDGHRWIISTPIKSGMTLPPAYSAAGGRAVDCVVQEIATDNTLLWTWRASDHIVPAETTWTPAVTPTVNGQTVGDVYHCNSIDVDFGGTGNVLVSFRHTAAVYLIDKVSGNTIWKMGGNSTHEASAQVLNMVGDTHGPFSGQHDARFQPSGHISLYDDHSQSAGAARGVDYTVNASGPPPWTATFSWEYLEPGGHFAGATGSFREYAGRTDNIVGWGFKSPGSGFSEVDGATSANVLMTMQFPNGEAEYRVVKEPLANLDINMLRATAGLPRFQNWQAMFGNFSGKPGSSSWASNRIDLFGTGAADQQLWHQWWDGTQWVGWLPGLRLGGTLTSGPAAVSWGPNRIDVFARGIDFQLWHTWWDGGTWNAWQPLGGYLTTGPAVASWASGRLDIVVAGGGGGLWHKWWDGSVWNDWQWLGGYTTFDPGVSSWGSDRLDIFIRNADGTMNHRWWDTNTWFDWEWHAASLTSGLSATSSRAGQIDVVGAGANNVPQRLEYLNGWQAWQSLGGLTPVTPSIVGRDVGVEEAFATGSEGGVYHQTVFAPNPPNQARAPSRSAAPNRQDASKL